MYIKKEKGISLIETIVIIVIVSIVTIFFWLKFESLNEVKDLELNSRKIQKLFYEYTELSKIERRKYDIEIMLNNKIIEIRNRENTVIERLELSKKLNYTIIYDRRLQDNFYLETTINGNLSKAFTMYSSNNKKILKRKLGFYTFNKSKLLSVNSYIYKGKEAIKMDGLLEYHYFNEDNTRDWRDE